MPKGRDGNTLLQHIAAQLVTYITLILDEKIPFMFLRFSPIAMPSKFQIACVNIIPLSPLMPTGRAASQIPITDAYNNKNHWRWLAEYWRGYSSPDITIKGILKDREVIT